VHYGQTRIVEVLLARGADVEARDDGKTLLMKPAEAEHLDMVRLLLSRGADVKARTPETGWTVLHSAARGAGVDPVAGDPAGEVVRVLVDRGADINGA
jgi:ankyrin repeat protein